MLYVVLVQSFRWLTFICTRERRISARLLRLSRSKSLDCCLVYVGGLSLPISPVLLSPVCRSYELSSTVLPNVSVLGLLLYTCHTTCRLTELPAVRELCGG